MMMLLVLAKKIPKPLFTSNRPFPTRFYSASTKIPGGFKVVDYLINSCGFSSEKAAKISKSIVKLKSPEKPDAIVGFLKHHGFTETNIKTLITLQPKLLYSSLQNTIDPNLQALRNMGLSSSAVNELILSGPAALQLKSAVSRIHFWRNFLGNGEATLLKAFKSNRSLITHDIGKTISPKLSLLQSHGLSEQDVRRIVLDINQFITSNTRLIEDLLKRTKELGFQPKSKMFLHGLSAMTYISTELFQKKMDLFKSFGWSEDEFLSAVRIAPAVVCLSEINLQKKMYFFMEEVGCVSSYIATNPILLTYSLEKRLRPRHRVLRLLESKGLTGKRRSFITDVIMPEIKFVNTYILPHEKDVSGLHEVYLVTCASESQSPFWKVEAGESIFGPNRNHQCDKDIFTKDPSTVVPSLTIDCNEGLWVEVAILLVVDTLRDGELLEKLDELDVRLSSHSTFPGSGRFREADARMRQPSGSFRHPHTL